MSRLFKTTLRVRLDTPEGRKAWGYLVSRDKSKYRSYSDAIIAAVNGYFDRERSLPTILIWKRGRRRTLSCKESLKPWSAARRQIP